MLCIVEIVDRERCLFPIFGCFVPNAFVSISVAYVTAHDVFYPALDLMHIGQGVEIVYLYGLFGSVSFVFTFFDVAC